VESPAAILGAVVLAAGEARRMDGRAKPLIERDGVPLVRRVAQALLDAGVDEVVVVIGHRSDEVAWAVHDLPVLVVVNEDYAVGHVRSLRMGLAAMPETVTAVLVALADQPLLEAADLRAVIHAWASRGPARAVVPRVQQRRGHPVMLDASACAEILRGDAGYGAREWLDEHPDDVAWLDSDNLHYVEDVDFPEDLERIAQRHGCSMRWPQGAGAEVHKR
jgi:molybdenum cofactor cytidylyltransferase